jgi:ribulose-5-phosphate 4-epimerase/fuculose-1-phosphate aldolase
MGKARLVSTSPKRSMSEAEWQARVELAACYRLADMHGMGKVVWNHITHRVPDEPDHMLVFRLGVRYDEVTASNLLKIRLDGTLPEGADENLNSTAFVIHGGVFRGRPDVMCVMHTHTRGGQGVAALKEGLLPLSQDSMKFYENLAYHDYEASPTTNRR